LLITYSPGAWAFFTFEFDVGVSNISYSETHSQQPSLDVDLSESVLNTEFGFRFPIITNWISVTADAQYLSPVLSSNSPQEISFLNYGSKLILTLAGRPFHLNLTAEYFSDDSTPSDTTFGYVAMTGLRFAAILDIPIPFTEGNLNVYIPYWVQIEGRTEFKASAQFKLGSKANEKVISLFRKGAIFEVSYETKKIEFSNFVRPVSISVNALTVSLGVVW